MPSSACPRCGSPLRPSPTGGPPRCPKCSPPHDAAADTRTSAGAPPPAAAPDYRGRTFGSYTILEEISRGAMGVVYKARQRVLNRIVALKVLIAGDLATEGQVKRFQREAQAAARLRHPAIVPIHEVGVFDGKHFFTMAFIEGRPLSELIREGQITTRRALDIAAEVAEALHYAHRQGVVHRDIKPSNIMIDPQGGCHIMDFGLAKQLDSDTKFTRTGTTVGTPAYMPPEQASGESPHVDHRADIYSLGAVLYEMLTGQPPFSGDTMMSTLMRVLNDDPVAPKRVNPRIHRDIQTIVLTAMEKNPERRYRTMGAMADDIRRFIAGESISARPASIAYRAWKALRKHRSAVFASAAVLIIGLAAYVAIKQQRAEYHRDVEEARERGKREGAKEVEQEVQALEQPTVKTVFEAAFGAEPLDSQWTRELGEWTVGDGTLAVDARGLAAIRTRREFTGNVTVTFEFGLPPDSDGSPQTQAVVGYYIGPEWRRSYRISIDGRRRPRLVLMNRQAEVAEVDCPSLEPDLSYTVTVKRSAISLEVRVGSAAGTLQRELAYNELLLPRRLGRSFPVGLFAEGARLRVRRFKVEQEFSPVKTTTLRAAEELFRDGSIAEARNRLEEFAQGYKGTYEGLAALFGIALCHQAERRDQKARDLLLSIEAQAPAIEHERVPSLLALTRLHLFFCCARLNEFTKAIEALGRIGEAPGGHVDPAWVWHFPRHLSDMLNNRAYDEALDVLRATVFGPNRQTLSDLGASLQAHALEATLASRVRLLAEGYCDHRQAEKIRDVYAAYPTPLLGDAFARAATLALRRGQRDEALAFLAFCSERRLSSPALTQAALDVANALVDADLYARLPALYAALADPRLAPVFLRAVRAATDKGQLDDALVLLELSARQFTEDSAALIAPDGPAIRLGKAFLAHGEVLKPIEIHRLFAPGAVDSSMVALFVEATQKAVDGDRPDDALALLDYCRENLGLLHSGLAAAAAQLVDYHVARGEFGKAGEAYKAYRNEAVASAAARAIAKAAAAGGLTDALGLFTDYARNRHPIPEEAVRGVASALAALEPSGEDTTARLDQYAAIYEAYESPLARSTLTLALGDAYVAVGRLLPALAQYEAAGDAEGRLRAGCIALELGQADRAIAQWGALEELADEGGPLAAVAAFMLGEAPAPEFRKAVGRALPSPLLHYLLGLRLWSEGDDGCAQELAQAAAGETAWFTPLAKRTRPGVSPDEDDIP